MASLLLVCPTPLAPGLGVAQVALALSQALRRSGVAVRLEEGWAGVRTPSGLRARLASLHASCPADGWFECPAPWAAALPRGGAPVVHRSTQPDLGYLASEAPGAGAMGRLRLAGSALRVLAGWRRVEGFACLGSTERAWMEAQVPWLSPRLHTYLHAPADSLRPALWALARQRAAPSPGRTRWLWVGRWAPHKGTAALLGFLGQRLALFPGETATLAGTGVLPPLPAALRGRVQLLPRFAPGELPGLLERHDAGLFTSVSEGWGLSLQEMLESGLPVFATRAGGVADLEPWFPSGLFPLPPPEGRVEVAPHLPREGYAEVFNWDAIGQSYAASLRMSQARPGSSTHR